MKGASVLWSSVNAATRLGYRSGLFGRVRLGPKTVSVGNIQAGGAGKTPLVVQIAQEAHDRKLCVCILTRGYKGRWERNGGVLSPSSVGVPSSISGDEPALLHDLCPHAWIGVGRDRIRQFSEAARVAGRQFDLVILDDGFQHWKIERDIDIVALTSATSEEALFRENATAVRHAQLKVWTKGETAPEAWADPGKVRVLFELDLAEPGVPPLWLVSGIGSPTELKRSVLGAGYQVKREFHFRDHFEYSEEIARDILEKAAKAGCQVALTGKDWVKWRELGLEREAVLVLEPKLKFVEGREAWNRILWGK